MAPDRATPRAPLYRRRAALLTLAAVLAGCGRDADTGPGGAPSTSTAPAAAEGGARPANLLLVTLDTTRADRLGCYGHEAAETPTLDHLAAEGVLFERCFAPSPTTLPSHATILTGLEPFRHGARNNGTHFLPRDVTTLAERLSAAGFATGAVVSALVLDSRFGLDQGFASYDDDLSGGSGGTDFGVQETHAGDSVARARQWLAERGEGRWFLWLHLFDPHSNYAPPEPWRARFADAPYDGELAYADAMLGELLDELEAKGVLDDTLVAVTADHGESLGEHGEATHGIFVYDATTHVPWILRHPSLARGARVAEVAGSVDLAPTCLELLGLPLDGELDGRSFAARARGAGGAPEYAPAYSESLLPYYNYGWSDLRALRDVDWRYVRAPRPELYALASDPRELDDVSESEPPTATRYELELRRLLPAEEASSQRGDPGSLDPELLADLEELGYAFVEHAPADDDERPDPKDVADSVERQKAAELAVAQGDIAGAERQYRALIAEHPTAIAFRDSLAATLLRAGRDADALALHEGSLALPGAAARHHLWVAELRFELGRDGWRDELERAKAVDPRFPLPWVREGDFVHMPADPEGALAAYRQALVLDEHCAPAWLGISRVRAAQRDAQGALEAARRATEADPHDHAAWFALGSMQAALGRMDEALPSFERTRELDPSGARTRLALAVAYATQGREEPALAEMRKAWELDREATERAAAGNEGLRRMLERVR